MKKVSIFLMLIIVTAMALFGEGNSQTPQPSRPSTPPPPPPKWAGITLNGEDDQLLEGTTWILADNAEGWTTTYEFRASGRVVFRARSPDLGAYTINSTETFMWDREGDFVRIIGSGGQWLREGKYYPQTQSIMLTFEGSDGRTFEETLVPLDRSSIASTPAPAPQTNVYVQPSAPAQTQSTPAPAVPTLQTGTYALSNSSINMTMNLSAGIVTTNLNNRQIWFGTYRVNGTQLVISVTQAISEYSSQNGLTFSYTITGNTSFSGNNETWVRTGF